VKNFSKRNENLNILGKNLTIAPHLFNFNSRKQKEQNYIVQIK